MLFALRVCKVGSLVRVNCRAEETFDESEMVAPDVWILIIMHNYDSVGLQIRIGLL
jgi:hypothetical protein